MCCANVWQQFYAVFKHFYAILRLCSYLFVGYDKSYTRSAAKTGGGSPLPKYPTLEPLQELYQDSPSFHGSSGGVETGVGNKVVFNKFA
jgi:hypothetical protein